MKITPPPPLKIGKIRLFGDSAAQFLTTIIYILLWVEISFSLNPPPPPTRDESDENLKLIL